jgi:hypothetical protein
VRVDDAVVLPEISLKLLEQSMIAVYIADRKFEKDLLQAASLRPVSDDLGIKSDPSYTCYMVDADNAGSSTGVMETMSYGVETPSALIPA